MSNKKGKQEEAPENAVSETVDVNSAGGAESDQPAKVVKARVLVDSLYGKCGQVVALDERALARAKADGAVDDTPAAVAYAESLLAKAKR